MKVSARTAAIAAAAVAAIGLGGAWFASQGGGSGDPFEKCRKGVAGGGQIGGSFTLTDETGATVTDAQIITEPSLLYFGYTYCPDVCPLDSARNAEATALLEQRGYSVTPVFVSVDSERDTPELLREFTDIMHPKMIGLTGSPEQIRVASQAYRTYFRVQDPGDPYTLIDHSTQTYLVFPGIGYVDFFNRDTSAEEMADRVACFIDATKSLPE